LQTRQPREFEARGQDGRPLLLRILPYTTEKGQVDGVVLTFVDIQIVKDAQQDVQKSEERLALIEHLVTDGIWDWNLETDEELLSPRWKQLLGYQDDELPNHASTWKRLIFAEDLPVALDALKRHLESKEPFDIKVRYRHRNGSAVWVACRGVALKDSAGKFTRMLGIHTNITDLIEIQNALQQSEQRFQQVAANIDEVFWLTDAKTHELIYVSPAYEKVWGRTCASLHENAREWIDAIHPEDRGEVARAYYALTEQVEFDVEYRIVRPDGSIHWVHDRRFPVFENGTDRFIRIAGIAEDITERKQNQDALNEAKIQLEQVNEVLKHQNEELTEFAHVASHDLKAPLRTLTAFSDALEQELDGKLSTEAAGHLRRITTGAQQMLALVDDLLQFSRAGRKELTWTTFPLAECVGQVLAALETQIRDADAEIVCDELPEVLADSVMLAQLFQNLIGNSLKFVGTDKPHIRITYEIIEGQAVFGVKDNGIGIKPKFKDRVFEAFKRLNSDDKYEGTGIGLTICKKIVQRHGGRIWVDCELGKGTHFRFTLGQPPNENAT